MYSAKKCFIVSAVADDIISMSTLLQLDVYGLVKTSGNLIPQIYNNRSVHHIILWCVSVSEIFSFDGNSLGKQSQGTECYRLSLIQTTAIML